MKRNVLLIAGALMAALSLGACGGGGGNDGGMTTDTGGGGDTGGNNPDTGGTHDGGSTDGGSHDSGGGTDAGMGTLLGPCTGNTDCHGTGEMCNPAWPGGLCTKSCNNSRQCGSGYCLVQNGSGVCLPQCAVDDAANGCNRYGSVCAPAQDPTDPNIGICIPSCFSSGAPTGYPSCPASAACDPYSGACSGMAATGANNGAACQMDTDCKGGRCITEVDTMGNPSGFLGGYCISFGRLPDPMSLMVNMPIPQSNCPTGSIPLFNSATDVEGDSAPCIASCMANTDCRPGYTCDKLGSAAMGFTTNGYCLPVDCSMTGMTCPSGTTCQTQMNGGMTFHVCASTGGADAGAVGDAG